MKRARASRLGSGPFRADQLAPGDPYELSHGHAIFCAPTGSRGGIRTLAGGAALATDPAVKSAGVDVGYSPDPGTLRAPDIAVGDVPDHAGWVRGVPPLAVEYADVGQDEEELQEKISDLLGKGTKLVWVVRLVGPRRVEVYENGVELRVVAEPAELTAPGILKNPVPVAVLFDPAEAYRLTLRNLLQREGYESLEAVRAEGQAEGRVEGRVEGRAQAIVDLLQARGIAIDEGARATILACADVERLKSWLVRAAAAERIEDVLGEG